MEKFIRTSMTRMNSGINIYKGIGIKTVRVTNDEIIQDIDKVLSRIKAHL